MLQGNYLRVVVVDDHPDIRRHAQTLIKKFSGFSIVTTCASVKEALAVIPETRPNLLLLDIILGDGTGFDLLDQIGSKDLKVIFLTAYQEHAIRALKIGALDYLLKPIDEEELKAAFDKALSSLPYTPENLAIAIKHFNRPGKRITFSTQEYLQVIDTRDIIYCQSDFSTTTFYLFYNRKITVPMYLKEFEKELPTTQFVRIHQSIIVSIDFIYRYDKLNGNVLLLNGVVLPVATRKENLLKSILKSNHQSE